MSHDDAPCARETIGDTLGRLVEGNSRFVAGEHRRADCSPQSRVRLAAGQSPAAAVLACSDSRVSPELIFDQGLGELFVVRVAGNVVDDTVLASLQYAVEHLGVRLIVILGHSRCGAVTSACSCDFDALEGPMSTLLGVIEPSVQAARECCAPLEDLVEATARLNVAKQAQSVAACLAASQILDELGVSILPAWYDLDSGQVEWL